MDIDKELQRADDLANLRVELPCDEWLALTEEQREFMLVIANTGEATVQSESEYAMAKPMEKAGLTIFGGEGWNHEGTYHLTYHGAMIIPRHLVKAKE